MAQTKAGANIVAARRIGISLQEYEGKLREGFKWCFACRGWKLQVYFGTDSSRYDGLTARCSSCKNSQGRKMYAPVPRRKIPGPAPLPGRDGDKLQARARVNQRVSKGLIPHPNLLPCMDCGHIHTEGGKRHEYDHYLGYGAKHHFDVQAVCTVCHKARERTRND